VTRNRPDRVGAKKWRSELSELQSVTTGQSGQIETAWLVRIVIYETVGSGTIKPTTCPP
jgi:hypothetical protein